MTSRRDLLKLTTLAAASAALPSLAFAQAGAGAIPKADKPLKILILGGTGFTGPFQVAYALARGHQVTLFNRGQRASPEWPGKVGHYLFVSTISVYADGSSAGMVVSSAVAEYKGQDAMAETQESLRADVGNLYGPLKALSEAEARKQFGDKVTIVRPGYIVGPRDETDRFTYWPKRIAQGGEVLVPGDGLDPVQIIDGRDLGEWMVRLAENGTTGTFNACGPDYTLTTDARVHGCHAVTGGPVSFTHVPGKFLEEQQVGLPIWVPREGSEYSGYGTVSNAKAIAAGLTFRPLATTVADAALVLSVMAALKMLPLLQPLRLLHRQVAPRLAWYRALPAERQAEVRAGIPREKEAELLKAWKAKQGG